MCIDNNLPVVNILKIGDCLPDLTASNEIHQEPFLRHKKNFIFAAKPGTGTCSRIYVGKYSEASLSIEWNKYFPDKPFLYFSTKSIEI